MKSPKTVKHAGGTVVSRRRHIKAIASKFNNICGSRYEKYRPVPALSPIFQQILMLPGDRNAFLKRLSK